MGWLRRRLLWGEERKRRRREGLEYLASVPLLDLVVAGVPAFAVALALDDPLSFQAAGLIGAATFLLFEGMISAVRHRVRDRQGDEQAE